MDGHRCPIVYVAPGDVSITSRNPNVMDPDEYEALKAAIEAHGFLQPVLVRVDTKTPIEDGDIVGETIDVTVHLVDGEHRLRAAHELGLGTVPAVVVREGDDVGRALRIGMNRIRGQLNLTAVGQEFGDLLANDVSVEELVHTGFTDDEIMKLVASTQERDPVVDAVQAAGDMPDPTVEEDRPKGFAIRLVFETEIDRARVKQALLEAAGNGGTMADGLLAMVKGEDDVD